jgi:hypothetical protein
MNIDLKSAVGGAILALGIVASPVSDYVKGATQKLLDY